MKTTLTTFLRRHWHALTSRPSFRVRHGDGTKSESMTYDAAQDYMKESSFPGTKEELVFDPPSKPAKPQQPYPYEV